MQNLFKKKYSKKVSIKIASQILGVSIDTVRRWDRKGVLHSTRRSGKDRLFEETELYALKEKLPLTASEAALTLKVSLSTLARLEKSGTLIPVRNKAGRREYPRELVSQYQRNKARRLPVSEKQLSSPQSPWIAVRFTLSGMAFGILILGVVTTFLKTDMLQRSMHTSTFQKNESYDISTVSHVTLSHSVFSQTIFEPFNTDHGLFVATE